MFLLSIKLFGVPVGVARISAGHSCEYFLFMLIPGKENQQDVVFCIRMCVCVCVWGPAGEREDTYLVLTSCCTHGQQAEKKREDGREKGRKGKRRKKE
jgi:hypothetical protein